ncbi:trace amine-associated receptor 2-like [Paramacrobiotus metropolitanus]|uniref:trace amine-associated receptor 2-like n=1 Tax=Paramacrobiotus metropolitanus TaxID=2943436 RepID=UPI0024457E17|nr:trace amine-associated receptor 2-like [Paramacrobiotus metropolitanus]
MFRNNSSFVVSPGSLILHDPLHYALYLAVTVFVCSLGTILSFLLLTAMIKERKLFHGSRLLIISQILTELQEFFIHLPLTLTGTLIAEIEARTVFHQLTFCQYALFFNLTVLCASIWGLCILAVNRFMAITFTKPMLYKRFSSWKAQLLQLLFVYMLTIGLHVTYLFPGLEASVAIDPVKICGTMRLGSLYTVETVVGKILPICLTIVVYLVLFVAIIRKKQRRQVRVGDNVNKTSNNVLRKRMAMAKLLGATAIVHGVTYLVYPVYAWMVPVPERNAMLTLWLRLSFHAGQLSTTIFFLAMSSDCRRAVRRLFRCNRVTERSNVNTLSTPQA